MDHHTFSMPTKPVMYQPTSIDLETEKPSRFYLKKWFIIVVAAVSLINSIIGILALSYLVGVGPKTIQLNQGDNSESFNLKAFATFFLVLGVITAIGELIGLIGAYMERLGLIKFYFVYCIARCVLGLVGQSIILGLARSGESENFHFSIVKIIFSVILSALFVAIVFYYMLNLESIEQKKRNTRATFTQEEAFALKV